MTDAPTTAITAARGPVWAAYLFLFSLLVPIYIRVGPLLLMPHRIVLLILFIPFFFRLFVSRRAGPVTAPDWLMLGAALWAGVALVANHPVGMIIEPFGIFILEFFGAYLLARVAIRSARDFRRVVWVFFIMVCILMPFAVMESVTHRPVLLELLPGTSVGRVDAHPRWGLRRAQTIFPHPIGYGIFVSAGLGLFWYALKPRWLRFPAVPIVAVATIVSLSTGALISLVMQAVFIGWETVMQALKSRWRLFLVLFAMAYVTVDMLSNRTPFHVLVDYASFSSGSAYGRILIWQWGTDNVWDNPIFGLGLRDWARPSWKSASLDNFWLYLAMYYGLPHIVMVICAGFLILRRVARAALPDREDSLARAAFLVTFGGIVIAGGTVHYWHGMMAFALFIIGSGLWTVTGGATPEISDGARPPAPVTQTRSRYTRQGDGGGRIPVAGATPSGAASLRRRATLQRR